MCVALDLIRGSLPPHPPRPAQPVHPSPPPSPLQLTADLFVGVCGRSEPRDVYLAATVGGWAGGAAGGDCVGSSSRALQNAGVPVLVCSSYRLQSAVARSLWSGGGGGGGGGRDRSEEATTNPKMGDVVRRAMSMVEIFEHWRHAGGEYAAAAADNAAAAPSADSSPTPETPGAEVEELVVTLARTRGSNAR